MSALVAQHENLRDRGLVERHQSGDEAAFTELYRIHFARLVRYCRHNVRDGHLAEEIAQEAFVRAYVALDRLGGERRFYPWLTVIARRLIIDHIRNHGRLRLEADVQAGSISAVDEIVVTRQDHTDLHTALERVRERHREILRLRDWEGLSYDAIAERLGLPCTAIPPLLHRARAALRREFVLVSEGRVAAFLHLPTLMLLARRGRDRLLTRLSWMPEPATFGAPLAAAVLTLAGFHLAGVGAVVETQRLHVIPASAIDGGWDVPAANPNERPHAAGMSETAGVPHSRTSTEHIPEQVHVPDVATVHVGSDPEGVERIRREGRRKPIFIDAGPVGLAGDPEADRRHFEGMAHRLIP
jgi:RNA polymerase sigma-70 factor (ECF subfamily)